MNTQFYYRAALSVFHSQSISEYQGQSAHNWSEKIAEYITANEPDADIDRAEQIAREALSNKRNAS